VRDKLRKEVDVRLITSQYENTPQWIEKLKEYDLDKVLRIQNRVPNKGIVVDSKVVALSSQNWSGDGTLRHRDATLIIHDPNIAQYYEQIFIHDWTTLADVKVVDASPTAPAAGHSPGARTRGPVAKGKAAAIKAKAAASTVPASNKALPRHR
jgi:phosphatidylserine/phosphatidylglycerophosphate/cardiolipin synthase-like enzyme